MPSFALKGLLAGLAAASALALATPVIAADHHPHRGHVVVRGHGGHAVVRVGRFHRFHAGHFGRLTVGERARWTHGHWWHGNRHGRAGWWWWAGGIWYWYPTAVYPYPSDISDETVYDYAPEGRSDDSWYYCSNPEGYYPYVKSCNGEWKAVPIQPSANADSAYGEPPGGDDQDANDNGDDSDMNDNDDDSYDENDNDDDNNDDDNNDDDNGNGGNDNNQGHDSHGHY